MLFAHRSFNDLTNLSLRVGDNIIFPVTCVRNLGVSMDRGLTMESHITSVTKMCFAQLRCIGQVRRCLNQDATRSLVQGLVTSRLDYCNALLYGLPANQLKRLQHVQNTAARIVSRTCRRDHITPVFISLHWLPVKYRIEYKIFIYVFKTLQGEAPVYMTDGAKPHPTTGSAFTK